MESLTEDNVKVIVQKILNCKVVYRANCILRHEGVDTLEKRVESMDKRMWAILIGMCVQLISIVAYLLLR